MSLLAPTREQVRLVPPAAALGLLALSVGYLSVNNLQAAIVLPFLPIALLLVLRPAWAVAAGIALLPVQRAVIGHEGGAAIVSPSDTAFLLAAIGLFPLFLLRDDWRERLRVASPLLVLASPFATWALVVLAAHPSFHTAFKTMTVLEITVIPIIFGASVLDQTHLNWALTGFLFAAAALSVLWILGGVTTFAGNKNGAGQYLALALLLTLILAAGRPWMYGLLLFYFLGLLFGASRGALIGGALGAISLLGLRGLGSWKRTATAVILLSAIVIGGYVAVPTSVQQKLQAILTATSDTKTSASRHASDVQASTDYNLHIRALYRQDGYRVIEQNPVFGVGFGNYVTGNGPTRTADPHNVLIRTAADGGIPNLVAFLFLVGSSTVLVLRRLTRNRWAGPALAIQVMILTHGLVDVYWTRGLPVLGWIMVGLALNPAFDRPRHGD